MQALPGITTSNDASSAPAIRGSGPQDNAYYIDFMPVGYLFHMGGMESVINPDLVEDFNIYASSFGPEYTDVTGGIVDVRLRNPRKDRLGGKVNLSLLEADFLVEGPVTPTQSFYFGARRSYIDLFLAKTGELDSGVNYQQFPQFYDYQGKYIWDLTPDNSLTLQTSGAEDQMELTFTDEADMVKHDPIIAGDLNMKMDYHSQGVLLASRISSRLTNKFGLSHLQTLMEEFLTQIGHVNIVTDSYYLRDHLSTVVGDNHEFLVGVEGGEVRFKLDMDMTKVMPSDFNADTDYTSSARFINNDSFASHWWDLALKDRWRVIDGWTLIVGGHGSYESYFGRYRLEPRVSTEIVPVKDTLITAGWGQYHQFPEGFQIIEGMGNRHLGYVNAEHYALGVEQRFKEGWSVKIEGYYKNLDDVVTPNLVENYSNDGSGTAYGSELLIKKNRIHDWSGWLAAGYSKTKRRNEVTGEEFPYSYDQPVIINLVYEWNFLPKWTVGAKWRYQSGAPFTPVNSTYTDSTGRIRPVYGELGSERLPDYHRLDLRIARDFLFNTWKIKAYLDIINAYDHKNIAGYEYNADYTDRAPITQLPLMPSIGITAEF
ncbi:MAG: hypothetical protein A2511_15580 [Deltaproteobacteria bacterium RIFOXYD12_FULL_50_9]|nr:MAG: hypothetical protein A2511_15580 [Deltaproteobacteria bacterium RIFOXYD12_FULL_50_9]